MEKQKFNLLDEPWIKVMTVNNEEKEVSLSEALFEAHRFKCLDGEMEAQNAALLRMMLGLLYSVFSRVDVEDVPGIFENPDDALDRWEDLWNLQEFPSKPLNDYFSQWHERFWLFDSQRPFYQIPEASIGTEYTAAKLIGSIGESGHKVRMFSERAGEDKSRLTYAEAARWLLYVNGFDDTASKKKGKGPLPSPGAGWLGRLGLIYAEGKNLFETLMLNLMLLDEEGDLWAPLTDKDCACWELGKPHTGERTEIPQPDNFAAMMTLQSRRILLKEDNENVSGFTLLGGDFFTPENAFCEPMTLWRGTEKKGQITYKPRRHDPSRLIWREFGSIIVSSEENHVPGIEQWIAELVGSRILGPVYKHVLFRITSVQYGDKDFFVTDSYSDQLSMYASLLTEKNKSWQKRIEDEIALCEKCAGYVAVLGKNLEIASGNTGEVSGSVYRERFYSAIDQPFRNWLYDLDPNESDFAGCIEKLRDHIISAAIQLGRELVCEAGPAALVGREIENKDTKKSVLYWAPQEFNRFTYYINKLYREAR